jgi:hypothetical protein
LQARKNIWVHAEEIAVCLVSCTDLQEKSFLTLRYRVSAEGRRQQNHSSSTAPCAERCEYCSVPTCRTSLSIHQIMHACANVAEWTRCGAFLPSESGRLFKFMQPCQCKPAWDSVMFFMRSRPLFGQPSLS